MLLETDHSTPLRRSTADTARTGEQSMPAAVPHAHDTGRAARGFSPSARSTLREPVKWLIGLPFHPSDSRVTWLYYVVDDADDGPHAVHAALERADGALERQARGGMPVHVKEIEVRRIIVDALGNLILERCP
ncbi:hypothetical protein ACFWBV_32075 [Streptomyces sp. NPDC060030]|uniref:hypothetical protein n=1 Tax=Streptomyces sp. NPDC060030 TaxID=3347042 RepID=UPI0036B66CBF